ncbi:MAG: sulfatase, partial [Planctomycetes bacterium]|nr:sulfatase [Planctomycetota bacterium]
MMRHRIGRRAAAALCWLGLVASCVMADAAERRSVLLLVSDNQNWNDCGCYGNRVVKTPHLDRLAAQGVRFNYAFATTASCGPSRAVLFTGLYTHQNGHYGHPQHYHNFHLRPEVQTIFALLKKAGYSTGLIGKSNVSPPEQLPLDYQPAVRAYDVVSMAREAAEFFRQAGDRPFFLLLGYHDPHPTSRAGSGWGIRRQYPGVRPVQYDPKTVIVPSYLPDRPEVREGLAGYYQQITRLDQGIGMVLDALERSGKAGETLILFTSDHGSSEPGAMANHYDPGVRVPLIVKSPEQKQRGLVTDAMVTFADLVPTILDWTGVPGPAYPLPGRSFLPVLEERHPAGWDEVYLSHVFHEVQTYYPMRTIRTRRYKLIWNMAWRQEYPLPLDTIERATWRGVVRRGDKTIGRRSVEKFLFRDPLELYDLEKDP